MKIFPLGLAVVLLSAIPSLSAKDLSYVDLVHRLTDLRHLAVLPQPGERSAQWSSYDRRSRYDAATGRYVDWDANGDGSGYIRKEGNKIVMAEMKGPGCIWRIWSAAPKNGHVRIYLDGSSRPAVDLPFIGYFNHKNAPFTRSVLVHTVARGWNNYTPIPYQKSCKIVADPGWGAYYHFDYSTFPAGTVVPTFTRDLSAADNAALDRANRILSHCGPHLPPVPGEQTEDRSVFCPPGGECVIHLTGPRAVRTIRAKLDPNVALDDRTTLREWTLQIRWDGETNPSVWAPFGDFFGTAAGPNPYRSYPSGLTKDGWWYSHWYMPFARSAEIKITNQSQKERKLRLEIVTVPLTADPATLGRFHAKWHRDAFLPTAPGRRIDWTLLTTQGAGRYVGVMLHVWNPRGGWWGEGDEKFFVDGEKFPSTFGTGSEDFFGYAWSNPTLFQNAYHDQTISMGNKGHICVNRWQIPDNVPFHTSFQGYIEKYFPNSRPTLYACTVYWYLAADGVDPYRPQPLSERIGYWNDAALKPFVVKGALEGEQMKILACTGGKTQVQDMSGYAGHWSHDAHLWWTQAKPGNRLVLALPVKIAGRYTLTAQLTKAVDYGIVQLALDGHDLGGPIDLFHRGVIATGPLKLGTMHLAAGRHRFEVTIVGANPDAIKSYMFGLDYVKLEPVR